MFRMTEDEVTRHYARIGRSMTEDICEPQQKTSKKRKTPKIRKTDVSPHAQALARLAKKPELIESRYEHYDQVRIFDLMERKHADIYDFLFAIPNGGLRAKATANALLAEGLKRGYPDMGLDVPRGVYHGLRIELKYGTNTPTDEQRKWFERLNSVGYLARIVWGWEDAVKLILMYWNLQDGEKLVL